MPNRNSWLSAVFLFGLLSMAKPASAQALIPHTLQLNSTQLEQQGLSLAQEAAQLAQFQQYELALPRARLATQLAPKSYQAWFLLGGLYLQTDEIDKGIEALQQARSLNGNEATILFALGSARFQKQQYQEAIADIQAGLKIKPNVPEALFDLGNAYYKLKQFPEAIAQYEKAIAADAKFWPAITNIGLIKYEQGNGDEAIRLWRRAMEIDKEAAEPQLAMAVALYAKGDREQGIALGETALRMDERYANVDFLKENLWGERLVKDAQQLLATPRIQATIAQVQDQRSQQQQSSPR
jgi:tetratricopeptide (TPR) repeat protein